MELNLTNKIPGISKFSIFSVHQIINLILAEEIFISHTREE